MAPNIHSDALLVRIAELQQQLKDATADRDRWRSDSEQFHLRTRRWQYTMRNMQEQLAQLLGTMRAQGHRIEAIEKTLQRLVPHVDAMRSRSARPARAIPIRRR